MGTGCEQIYLFLGKDDFPSINKYILKYLGAKNYYSIATNAIKEMYEQVDNLKTDGRNIAYRGLLIRHLIMPQNLAGADEIFRYIAEEISKDTYINIMVQYYPAHKAFKYEELSRRISEREYKTAIEIVTEVGLKRINYTSDFI